MNRLAPGRVAASITSVLCVLASTGAHAGDPYPIRPLVECTPRGGLPNFFAKLSAGGEVRIGYLGGSITAQGGWRVYSRKWFQEQYPQAQVSEINAAIGGTGSGLGVFRVEHDVLRHKPDMLFVEFAVNDGGTPPDRIVKAMEGIVRQTWRALPACDICFVYTFTHRLVKKLSAGRMQRSASAMEAVADHYRIPTIHMAVEAIELLREGKLEVKAPEAEMTRVSGDELNVSSDLLANDRGVIPFSRDGVHPYVNTGHRLYLNAIVRSMPGIRAMGYAVPHVPGPALDADNWEMARMVPLEDAARTGTWKKFGPTHWLAKRFGTRMPGVWKASPGATLSFRFRGTKVSIYDILGPGCGYVEVSVDGKTHESCRMDGYSTYHRLATLGCADNMENVEHTVEITVLDRTFDKKAVLFERNRQDLLKHPKKYRGVDWYPGAIFIVGEMVK